METVDGRNQLASLNNNIKNDQGLNVSMERNPDPKRKKCCK